MEGLIIVVGIGALVALLVWILAKDALRERDKHRAAKAIIDRSKDGSSES